MNTNDPTQLPLDVDGEFRASVTTFHPMWLLVLLAAAYLITRK